MSSIVIVNSTLQKSEICRILQTQHKVKYEIWTPNSILLPKVYNLTVLNQPLFMCGQAFFSLLSNQVVKACSHVSELTTEGSCIFPVSSVAFLVLRLSDILPGDGKEVYARLEKFIGIHRCPYAICIASEFKEKEFSFLCALQKKYNETSLQFLPSHNHQECVEVMNTIAKAHSKPTSDVLKTRLKSLTQGVLRSEETRDGIFAQLPVSQHDRQILQDTLHSIENVAMATEEDFLEYTSLDRDSIKAVIDFFRT